MTGPNKTPAPNRRPGFPLGSAAWFGCLFCAPPAFPAAVGEAQRWPVANLEGVPSSSSGLRGTSYPGYCAREGANPERVASFGSRHGRGVRVQPFQGWMSFGIVVPG